MGSVSSLCHGSTAVLSSDKFSCTNSLMRFDMEALSVSASAYIGAGTASGIACPRMAAELLALPPPPLIMLVMYAISSSRWSKLLLDNSER